MKRLVLSVSCVGLRLLLVQSVLGAVAASAADSFSAAVVDTRADILAEQLAGLPVELSISDESVLGLTLTGSIVELQLPTDLGDVALDLKTFAISGTNGANGSASVPGGNGSSAITVAGTSFNYTAAGMIAPVTAISVSGTTGAAIVGGNGGDGYPAGKGALAIVDNTGAAVIITDPNQFAQNGVNGVTICPSEDGGVVVKVDDKWIEDNVGKGATAEQVAAKLNSTDTANGLKVWQEVALGVAEGTAAAKPAITGAAKGAKGAIAFTVPGYVGNAKSGVTVTRKLVTKIGATETQTGIELNATSIAVDESDVSEENPVALYKTVLEFSDGSDGSTTKESDNTVGVMYAKPSAKLAIVAVPWEQIGGGNISAADLIDTRDLADGDKLHVYDRANRKYKTWTLESGEWKGLGTYAIGNDGKVSSESAGDPGEMTIARGDGVWLERGSAANPFHLIGQYNAAKAMPTVETGWNLLGNASIEDTTVGDLGYAQDNDTVIVPTVAAPVRYTKKDGKWGYYKETTTDLGNGRSVTTSTWTPGSPIKVGEGFWIVR